MSATLELTQALIRCPSITPHDAGCQNIISQRLLALGFQVEALSFGEVNNLWAKRGNTSPLLVFAGHTDVVPPGPLEAWDNNPFQPTLRDGFLYGRGATDMKSGLAAMIVAVENFIQNHPLYAGSIAFLITSDEEGPSINGTQKVIAELTKRKEKIDYCIIAEASSDKLVGDQIRIGRRGSLHGKLIVRGKQGHIAYPERAENPIHRSFLALEALAQEVWDTGNEHFPPTTFQISNIHSGTGATNVIPGHLEALFNFRFSTAVTTDELQQRVTSILNRYHLHFEIQWELAGVPFLTATGKLLEATQQVIKKHTGLDTILSTGGGTSDGRFIAPTGAEVIELGPLTATAHQINERVAVADLEVLTHIYTDVLKTLMTP
jgi:succinyl-diaminopimelate desuccinylase